MSKRSVKYGIGYIRSRGKYLYGEINHNGSKIREAVKSVDDGKAWIHQKQVELANIGYCLDQGKTAQIGAALKRLPLNVGITDVVDFYLIHHPTNGERTGVARAIDDLVAERKRSGLRERSIQELEWRLGKFKRDYGHAYMDEISAAQIEGWLDSLHAVGINRKNYIRYLRQLFIYSKKHGHCPTNPVDRIGKIVITPKPPGILTVEQAARLIEQAKLDGCVRFFGIGLFCGLRAAELGRIGESDVCGDHVSVRAEVSKKRRQRYATIPDNLKALIRNCGETGPINITRKRFERVIRNSRIENWPNNAMRHSFASYHLAHHQDASKTAFELGHVSPALVYDHYRMLVPKEEAEKYWRIGL